MYVCPPLPLTLTDQPCLVATPPDFFPALLSPPSALVFDLRTRLVTPFSLRSVYSCIRFVSPQLHFLDHFLSPFIRPILLNSHSSSVLLCFFHHEPWVGKWPLRYSSRPFILSDFLDSIASIFDSSFLMRSLWYPVEDATIPTVREPLPRSEVRTLFVSNVPLDVMEREVHLLFRFFPGYEGCSVARPEGKNLVMRFHRSDWISFITVSRLCQLCRRCLCYPCKGGFARLQIRAELPVPTSNRIREK